MKFLKKLIELFQKARKLTKRTQNKIKTFVADHKPQIKIIMNVLDVIYPAKTGIKKMANVVETVCYAIGLDDCADEVRDFVEAECQKIFDELRK